MIEFYPQIFYLLLIFLNIAITAYYISKSTNFTSIIHQALLEEGIFIFLLYQGGFFRFIGGAQIIWIIVNILYILPIVLFWVKRKEIQIDTRKIRVSRKINGFIFDILLIWWGGFFDAFINFLKYKL
jgi:hypothetical protein